MNPATHPRNQMISDRRYLVTFERHPAQYILCSYCNVQSDWAGVFSAVSSQSGYSLTFVLTLSLNSAPRSCTYTHNTMAISSGEGFEMLVTKRFSNHQTKYIIFRADLSKSFSAGDETYVVEQPSSGSDPLLPFLSSFDVAATAAEPRTELERYEQEVANGWIQINLLKGKEVGVTSLLTVLASDSQTLQPSIALLYLACCPNPKLSQNTNGNSCEVMYCMQCLRSSCI